MCYLPKINELRETENRLLRDLAMGSHDAFDRLYRLNWLWVFKESYKRLGNKNEAENITQDVFLTIWENRESTSIRNLQAYLYVLTKNKTLNFILKNKPDLISDYEDQLHDENSPLKELITKETKSRISLEILSLPPQQQKVFVLHYQENKSTNEIAESMGISVKTVRNHLARAANSVRSILKAFLIFLC